MRALEWTGHSLKILDQRQLPHHQIWDECTTAEEVAEAIRCMKVRGAPAIGAAAAYGVALEAVRLAHGGKADFRVRLDDSLHMLALTRPTAVNLFWAIEKMRETLNQTEGMNHVAAAQRLVTAAETIADEDIRTNRRIGQNGSQLFAHKSSILTHCNTGSLATVEFGTALGVIRALHGQGKLEQVWVDETRPYLQGARLTAFELSSDGIPFTLITDNMAGHFLKLGAIDAVIVGADRIAENGDTANKIGTYSLAVLCQYHKVPFYVAAPVSTFDLTISTGNEIPIEERSVDEVVNVLGNAIAPANTHAAHPAFDVTPHELITAIITETGVIQSPDTAAILRHFHRSDS